MAEEELRRRDLAARDATNIRTPAPPPKPEIPTVGPDTRNSIVRGQGEAYGAGLERNRRLGERVDQIIRGADPVTRLATAPFAQPLARFQSVASSAADLLSGRYSPDFPSLGRLYMDAPSRSVGEKTLGVAGELGASMIGIGAQNAALAEVGAGLAARSAPRSIGFKAGEALGKISSMSRTLPGAIAQNVGEGLPLNLAYALEDPETFKENLGMGVGIDALAGVGLSRLAHVLEPEALPGYRRDPNRSRVVHRGTEDRLDDEIRRLAGPRNDDLPPAAASARVGDPGPSGGNPGSQERVVAAAWRWPEGSPERVTTGINHDEATPDWFKPTMRGESGFVTNTNRFVTDEEALEISRKARQFSPKIVEELDSDPQVKRVNSEAYWLHSPEQNPGFGEPERVVAATFHSEDGSRVFRGRNHGEAEAEIARSLGIDPSRGYTRAEESLIDEEIAGLVNGFETNTGRLLGREEGQALARETNALRPGMESQERLHSDMLARPLQPMPRAASISGDAIGAQSASEISTPARTQVSPTHSSDQARPLSPTTRTTAPSTNAGLTRTEGAVDVATSNRITRPNETVNEPAPLSAGPVPAGAARPEVVRALAGAGAGALAGGAAEDESPGKRLLAAITGGIAGAAAAGFPRQSLEFLRSLGQAGEVRIGRKAASAAGPERVLAAAVRGPNGRVYAGTTFDDARAKLLKATPGVDRAKLLEQAEEVFVTSNRNVVSPQQALEIANRAVQKVDAERLPAAPMRGRKPMAQSLAPEAIQGDRRFGRNVASLEKQTNQALVERVNYLNPDGSFRADVAARLSEVSPRGPRVRQVAGEKFEAPSIPAYTGSNRRYVQKALIARGHSPYEVMRWGDQRLSEVVRKELQTVKQAEVEEAEFARIDASNKIGGVEELMAVTLRGAPERFWYEEARQAIKARFGGAFNKTFAHPYASDAELYARIVAATSAGQNVKNNIRLADQVYEMVRAGNLDGARRLASGIIKSEDTMLPNIMRAVQGNSFDWLSSPKVTPFAESLAGTGSNVQDNLVLDQVAFRWIGLGAQKPDAYGDVKYKPTLTELRWLRDRLWKVADRLGWTPEQVQAGLWYGIRRVGDGAVETGERAGRMADLMPRQAPGVGVNIEPRLLFVPQEMLSTWGGRLADVEQRLRDAGPRAMREFNRSMRRTTSSQGVANSWQSTVYAFTDPKLRGPARAWVAPRYMEGVGTWEGVATPNVITLLDPNASHEAAVYFAALQGLRFGQAGQFVGRRIPAAGAQSFAHLVRGPGGAPISLADYSALVRTIGQDPQLSTALSGSTFLGGEALFSNTSGLDDAVFESLLERAVGQAPVQVLESHTVPFRGTLVEQVDGYLDAISKGGSDGSTGEEGVDPRRSADAVRRAVRDLRSGVKSTWQRTARAIGLGRAETKRVGDSIHEVSEVVEERARGLGVYGKAHPEAVRALAGAGAGAAVGAATDDDPAAGALLGGLVGAASSALLPAIVRQAREDGAARVVDWLNERKNQVVRRARALRDRTPPASRDHLANSEVREISRSYAAQSGLRPLDLTDPTYHDVPEDQGRAIADFYESAQDGANDPQVLASYAALREEAVRQWDEAVAAGYTFEPWRREGQPYANSQAMRDDVAKNRHLWYFPTDSGFGGADDAARAHPMLEPSGVIVGGEELPLNDVFRANHDFYGHAKEGMDFGPRGEHNAWIQHSRMFSDQARPAMSWETRGQNSWVNYGAHLRRPDGSIPKKGDPDFIPLEARPYAEQKVGVLPAELATPPASRSFLREGAGVQPEMARALAGAGVGGAFGATDDEDPEMGALAGAIAGALGVNPRSVAKGLRSIGESGFLDLGPILKAPGFKQWFGRSKAVDNEGRPVLVYRGEHGPSGKILESRHGSITFTDDPRTADLYAQMPNDRTLDKHAERPRVTPAVLRIENPFLANPNEPFLDLSHVMIARGREEAERVALKFADYIEDTGFWREEIEPFGIYSVEEFIEKNPGRLGELYFEAFRFLDDAEEVGKLREAGYDGAILHGMGGADTNVEYRVFSPSQVKSAISGQALDAPEHPRTQFENVRTLDWEEPVTLPDGSLNPKRSQARRGGATAALRDGTKVRLEVVQPFPGKNMEVRAYAGNKRIGTAQAFERYRDGDFEGSNAGTSVQVSDEWKRKGLATAMYDLIEDLGGGRMHPADALSPEAKGFWRNRARRGEADPAALRAIAGAGVGAAVGGATGEGDPEAIAAGALTGFVGGNLPGIGRALRDMGTTGAFGKDITPAFWSRLGKAINAFPDNAAHPENWRSYFRRRPYGVAKGEMEWVGVEQILDDAMRGKSVRERARARITKKELQDAFERNQIRLAETRRGGPLPKEHAELQARGAELSRRAKEEGNTLLNEMDAAGYSQAAKDMARNGPPMGLRRAFVKEQLALAESRNLGRLAEVVAMATGTLPRNARASLKIQDDLYSPVRSRAEMQKRISGVRELLSRPTDPRGNPMDPEQVARGLAELAEYERAVMAHYDLIDDDLARPGRADADAAFLDEMTAPYRVEDWYANRRAPGGGDNYVNPYDEAWEVFDHSGAYVAEVPVRQAETEAQAVRVAAGMRADEPYQFDPDVPDEVRDAWLRWNALQGEMRRVRARLNSVKDSRLPTKFEQYAEPGGQDYEEIVIQLKPKPVAGSANGNSPVVLKRGLEARQDPETGRWGLWDTHVRNGGEGWIFHDGATAFSREEALEEARGDEMLDANWRQHSDTPEPMYRHNSHFNQEDNALVHARVKVREMPNGEKALFVEEIQSDWHQQGRKRGYTKPGALAEKRARWDQLSFEEIPALMAERERLLQQAAREQLANVEDPALRALMEEEWEDRYEVAIRAGLESYARSYGDSGTSLPSMKDPKFGPSFYEFVRTRERLQELTEERNLLDDALRGDGIPDAPYKKTQEWVGLAMRRLIDLASERGLDRVVWTTGTQQAKRYGLAQHYTRIRWNEQTKELQAFARGGSRRDVADVTRRNLADHVGDDLAARMIASKPDGYGLRELSGVDLEMGGEGHKTFYDEIIPGTVRDYARKMGVKIDVEPAAVFGGPGDFGQGWVVLDADGYGTRYQTRQEAQEAVENADNEYGEELRLAPLGARGAQDLVFMDGRQNLDEWRTAAIKVSLRDDLAPEDQGVIHRILQSGTADNLLARVRAIRGSPALVKAIEEEAVKRFFNPAQAPTNQGVRLTPELKKAHSERGRYLYSGLDPKLLADAARSPGGRTAIGAGIGAAVGSAVAGDDDRLEGGILGAAAGAGLANVRSMARRARGTRGAAGTLDPGGIVNPGASSNVGEAAAELARTARPLPDDFDMVDYIGYTLDTSKGGETELVDAVRRVVEENGLAPKEPVTWAETRREASKLIKDMGLSDEDLDVAKLQRHRLSAPEMLAIRDVISGNVARAEELSHAVTTGTDLQGSPLSLEEIEQIALKLQRTETRTDELLDVFIRARSQAGRDLNSLKILAKASLEPTTWLSRAQRLAGGPLPRDVKNRIMGFINRGDRAGLANFVAGLRSASWKEKLATFWKAGLLTAPPTDAANLIGNTMMGTLENVKDVPAFMADRLLMAAFTGLPSTNLPSVARTRAQLKGAARGAKEGAEMMGAGDFLRSIQAGEGVIEAVRRMAERIRQADLTPNEMAKMDFTQVNFDNPLLDVYTKGVFKRLGAEDRIFRGAAISRSLYDQATLIARAEGWKGAGRQKRIEELLANPADDMVVKAIAEAEYATFQNPGRLAAGLGGLKRPFGAAGEAILPFSRTPANIATRVMEYSPLGLAVTAKSFFEFLGQTTKDPALQKKISESFGRAVTGSLVLWAGYELASRGLMTGTYPAGDAGKQGAWELEGKQENSVKVDGKWHSLQKLSPVGQIMVVGAAMHDLFKDAGSSLGDKLFGTLGTVGAVSIEMSPLQGIEEFINVLREPGNRGGRWARSMAGSTIPAVVGRVARIGDDKVRSATDLKTTMQSRIPGLRKRVPSNVDVFGDEVPASPGVFDNLFNPLGSRADRTIGDPLRAEMQRTGAQVSRLRKSGNETPEQLRQRRIENGAYVKEGVRQTIQAPDYQEARQIAEEWIASDPDFKDWNVETLTREIQRGVLEDAASDSRSQYTKDKREGRI